MKHKTDKNHFDHQRHFVHFLWASNRGQQVYDMRIVKDNKKLGLKKKKPQFEKKSEFFKKTLSFEKNLSLKKPVSFEKIWVLKNVLK